MTKQRSAIDTAERAIVNAQQVMRKLCDDSCFSMVTPTTIGRIATQLANLQCTDSVALLCANVGSEISAEGTQVLRKLNEEDININKYANIVETFKATDGDTSTAQALYAAYTEAQDGGCTLSAEILPLVMRRKISECIKSQYWDSLQSVLTIDAEPTVEI